MTSSGDLVHRNMEIVHYHKDKAGKAGSIDNYRSIAKASLLSKVLEKILLDRLSSFIFSTDSQFGFKANHSTDLCRVCVKRNC